jgi:tetratricopeptide (TPR) repeat protein
MTQKKFDLAIKDYDAAIQRSPRKAANYQQRAIAKKISGQLDGAVLDFSRAIKLNPSLASAWMGRGFVWFQKEESARAVADFSEVIKLDPKNAQAYNNRGYNRQLLGDEEEALADFEQAISLAANYGLAYQNKAWLLATSNNAAIRDGKKAVEAATKACELADFKDVADVKALAAAFAEAGDFSRAIGWQEKVIGMVPEDERETERLTLEKLKTKQPLRSEDPPPTKP